VNRNVLHAAAGRRTEMAASPKTKKAAGSGGKASKPARKPARKPAGSAKSGTPARKSAGSAEKASRPARKSSGSRQKATASTGSAQTEGARSSSRRGGTETKSKATGPRQKTAARSRQKATDSKAESGIYVYAILPSDVELTSGIQGVGDPPAPVSIVRSNGLAALVSEVDVAHEQVVDATAGEVPVLPARFGAVLPSEQAVVEELLEANSDEFEEALGQLDGRAQYVVKGRYVENRILEEIISENRQAARLREKLRDADPQATRDARIRLGEIINEAVKAKRHEDTHVLGHAMDGLSVASIVREPTHELDAVHVAFLVDTDRESEMEHVIDDLAADWEGRVDVRLLGPMAAYDFVGTTLREG
jgi:hypothetical protein